MEKMFYINYYMKGFCMTFRKYAMVVLACTGMSVLDAADAEVPGSVWSDFERVTGITPAQLEGAPTFEGVLLQHGKVSTKRRRYLETTGFGFLGASCAYGIGQGALN